MYVAGKATIICVVRYAGKPRFRIGVEFRVMIGSFEVARRECTHPEVMGWDEVKVSMWMDSALKACQREIGRMMGDLLAFKF